jgi:hypothetical protein
MRNADHVGDVPRIMDVLPCATGAFLLDGGAVIVQLQRGANDIIAFSLQHGSHHRTVDPA